MFKNKIRKDKNGWYRFGKAGFVSSYFINDKFPNIICSRLKIVAHNPYQVQSGKLIENGTTFLTDGKINLGGMGASTYYKNNINLKKLLTEFQADNTIQVSAGKSTNNNPELKTKGENDE